MRYDNGNSIKITSYDNRGMTLEDDLNTTNDYYLLNNIACIHKKPTPIQVVKVKYFKKSAIIYEAFFKKPSTTDYNGIYKGKYIDFEAKETNLLKFPLTNLNEHQLHHLKLVKEMGGISFIIVSFKTSKKIYLLETLHILFFVDSNKKSIPEEYFKNHGYELELKYIPRLDYLKIVDYILEGEGYEVKD